MKARVIRWFNYKNNSQFILCGIVPSVSELASMLSEARNKKAVVKAVVEASILSSNANFYLTIFKSDQIKSCEVGCTLFDMYRNQFLGRTCVERIINNGHNGKLNIGKNIYFYTSYESNLAVVVEVSVHQKQCKYYESIGWCYIEPLQHARKIDVSSKTSAPYHRISLMYGSPRSLLLLEKPLGRGQEDSAIVPELQTAQLVYTVQSHLSLLKICHLFPENVLISGTEIIPGLVPVKKHSLSGVADHLRKPNIKKCTTWILDNVSIKVLPSIAVFEEEMLRKIKEERTRLEDISLDFDFSVSERRLNIGVHNGWTYIQQKEVQHLIMDNFRLSYLDLHTSGRNKTGDGKTKRENCGSSFVLRSRVKLLDVPEDTGICVVFALEYILSIELKSRERKASLPTVNQHPSLTVTLCWGKWFPFARTSHSGISVKLISDPFGNPDEKLLYKTQNIDITIFFDASMEEKEKELPEQFSDDEQPVKTENPPLSTGNITESATPALTSSPNTPVCENTSLYQSLMKETELTEVALADGSQLPILPIVKKQQFSCRQPSHAVCSFLHSAGFPVVCDQHGKVPYISEGLCQSVIDFEKEVTDLLKCNDIVIQFLALSWQSNNKPCNSHFVYFSFEFYRFPPVRTERLLLEDEDYSYFTKPCILHTLKYDGTKQDCPPGYQIRYHVDPAYLSPGEQKCFLEYLCKHWMQIDIWDGNSLLYIGTASLQLKHLCRQGKEAVQAILELEIWQADYAEESADKEVASNFDQFQGILYVKVSNVGSPLSVNSLKKLEDLSESNFPPILKSQVLDGEQNNYYSIRKAQPLVELNHSLASFLTSHYCNPYVECVNGMSTEKRRKLCRMEAVRKAEMQENSSANHCEMGDIKMFTERIKDLEIIDAYRENHKSEDITSLLAESITSEATIHPCKGTAYFFEFELFNPYSKGCRIFVEYQHANLKIVNDVNEWQHLRQLWNIEGKIEHQSFSKTSGTHPHIFLQSHERIRIPFKYHIFHHDDSITEEWQATAGHVFSTEILTKYPILYYYKPLMTKVYFKTQESKVLYILNLHIQPLPPAVDQTFHFLASENAFFKRWIRIPKAAMISISENSFSNIKVLCSDSNVVSGIQKSENGKGPVDIYIKVACGEAGTKCKFFLFIYENYLSKPIQTWLINVSAIHRIDLCLSVGHCCQSSLIIRGLPATQLVQCFSSHPNELQLSPSDYFTLPANTMKELKLILQSLVPGTRKMYINMVDMEFHMLLKTWLIVISCQKPTISKTFQLHLPLQYEHGVTRKITYANPYNYPKTFILHNSHPQLLQLAERELSVNPKESTSIGLYFPPQSKPVCEDIYIFINNMEGKNEETFSIRLTVS